PAEVDVLILRRHTLVLAGLLLREGVRHAAPRLAGENGPAELVVGARGPVEAHEAPAGVTVVVQVRRVDWIEEAIGFRPVDRGEQPEILVAVCGRDAPLVRAEPRS